TAGDSRPFPLVFEPFFPISLQSQGGVLFVSGLPLVPSSLDSFPLPPTFRGRFSDPQLQAIFSLGERSHDPFSSHPAPRALKCSASFGSDDGYSSGRRGGTLLLPPLPGRSGPAFLAIDGGWDSPCFDSTSRRDRST